MELANQALVFFREGGWLALFLASAYVNYRMYAGKEILRRELAERHAAEIKKINADSLAERKEARIEMKTMQAEHMSRIVALFERMADTADTMATYQRRANRQG